MRRELIPIWLPALGAADLRAKVGALSSVQEPSGTEELLAKRILEL